MTKNLDQRALVAAKLASLIGDKLEENCSAVHAPEAADVTFETVRNRVQGVDAVCRFTVPNGVVIPFKAPVDLETIDDDYLAHVAEDLAEAIDALASQCFLEEDYLHLRGCAEGAYAAASAEGLPVRLVRVRIEPAYAHDIPEIVIDTEELGPDLRMTDTSFTIESEEDILNHLATTRELLPLRLRMRDRMNELGGALLFDDVTVRLLERSGVQLAEAVATYLEWDDDQRHPVFSFADGGTLMIYAVDGVIRCEGRIGKASWTVRNLRLSLADLPAFDSHSRLDTRIGDLFNDLALDPDLLVEAVQHSTSSISLTLSTPKIWSVARDGASTEFTAADCR